MSEERRRFFRLQDQAVFTYQVVHPDELESVMSRLYGAVPDTQSLASAFAATSANMRIHLEQVRRKQPEMASYLQQLNEKLDLLVQLMAANDNGLHEEAPRTLSLSASGMGFVSSSAHEADELLEVRLLLLPAYACVQALGKVVRCEESSPGRYILGIDFDYIRESDRELIVKHVTERQSALLRESALACEDDGH